jgi:hypothetical protein
VFCEHSSLRLLPPFAGVELGVLTFAVYGDRVELCEKPRRKRRVREQQNGQPQYVGVFYLENATKLSKTQQNAAKRSKTQQKRSKNAAKTQQKRSKTHAPSLTTRPPAHQAG